MQTVPRLAAGCWLAAWSSALTAMLDLVLEPMTAAATTSVEKTDAATSGAVSVEEAEEASG